MTAEQAALFELLKTFSSICDKNNLQYFLVGGTLLGAARHQGFIPWDDDVDVAMPEEDYQRFLALKNTLPPEIEIQCQETDEHYPFLFSKLCNTRFPYNTPMPHGPRGLFVDIFPLVPLKTNSAATRTKLNVIKVIDYILQIRFEWAKNVPYQNKIALLGFQILKYIPTKTLKKIQSRLIRQLRGAPESKFLGSLGGAYKAGKEIFPKNWFSDCSYLRFETAEFKVPCSWHDYLSRNYGDYMILPSIENRVSRHK